MVKIGDTATQDYLSLKVIPYYGNGFESLYSAKVRSDLTPADATYKLENDDSLVYEIIEPTTGSSGGATPGTSFKGWVATEAELPTTGNEVGDWYKIGDEITNTVDFYAIWNGTEWELIPPTSSNVTNTSDLNLTTPASEDILGTALCQKEANENMVAKMKGQPLSNTDFGYYSPAIGESIRNITHSCFLYLNKNNMIPEEAVGLPGDLRYSGFITQYGPTYRHIQAVNYVTGQMYQCHCNNGVWSDWYQVNISIRQNLMPSWKINNADANVDNGEMTHNGHSKQGLVLVPTLAGDGLRRFNLYGKMYMVDNSLELAADNNGINFYGGSRLYKKSGQGVMFREQSGQRLKAEDSSGNVISEYAYLTEVEKKVNKDLADGIYDPLSIGVGYTMLEDTKLERKSGICEVRLQFKKDVSILEGETILTLPLETTPKTNTYTTAMCIITGEIKPVQILTTGEVIASVDMLGTDTNVYEVQGVYISKSSDRILVRSFNPSPPTRSSNIVLSKGDNFEVIRDMDVTINGVATTLTHNAPYIFSEVGEYTIDSVDDIELINAREEVISLPATIQVFESYDVDLNSYPITTASEFYQLNETFAAEQLTPVNCHLVGDLDFATLPNATIMGHYVGDFNGNGFKILNWVSNVGGMFKYLSGTVRNLYIENPICTRDGGDGCMGSVANVVYAGKTAFIKDVSVTNTTLTKTGNSSWGAYVSAVGGIVGYCKGALTISNCKVNGTIESTNNTFQGSAGVIGILSNGVTVIVENTYAIIDILAHNTGNYTMSGGFVGDAYECSQYQINNSYFYGKIVATGTGPNCLGGFVGRGDSNTANVVKLNNSFAYTTEITGSGTEKGRYVGGKGDCAISVNSYGHSLTPDLLATGSGGNLDGDDLQFATNIPTAIELESIIGVEDYMPCVDNMTPLVKDSTGVELQGQTSVEFAPIIVNPDIGSNEERVFNKGGVSK